MTDTVLATMRDVTQEVLETMFFSEAETVSCTHCENCLTACVHFSGRLTGQVTVTLSRTLALSASAGFLAEDTGEVTDEQLQQVACELTNIICGALLSRLHPDAHVNLDAPGLALPDNQAPFHQCFATPEGMLAVSVRLG